MARNYRFFLRNPVSLSLLTADQQVCFLNEQNEPEIVFQLLKVLRAKPGDAVTFLQTHEGAPTTFMEYDFEITTVSKRDLSFKPCGTKINTNELKFPLNLYLCLPNKPEKLEFMLQKATEIGVSHIVLFEGEFSQMKHNLRLDRLQKIIMEAAEQSERAVVPTLSQKGELMKSLEEFPAREFEHIWVAMERSGASYTAANPFSAVKAGEPISLLIGPEGGFSPAEKTFFASKKIHTFSLGKRILRMETAAILSLGLASLAYGS